MTKAELIDRLLQESKRAVRFGVVGLAGFFVDAAILSLVVYRIHANPLAGRAASVPVAIVFTFLCNRRWSFADVNKQAIGKSFAAYVSTQGTGLLCNLTVYTATILVVANPLAALAISSATAMTANYLGARFWAFRG